MKTTTQHTPESQSDSIYDTLRAMNAEIDNHESDLYVKRTPEVLEAVNAAYHRGDIHVVSTFRHAVTGEMWLEIPFAFLPWWQARQQAKSV